jgi:hypothetical protein
MRRMSLATYLCVQMSIVLAAAIMGGCVRDGSPTYTLHAEVVAPPLHHNIPATFKGHPEGPIVYLCATQLRRYEGRLEEDHYLQYEQCPTVPIR